MDLTVAAIPAYFATMGGEHWWLRRRAKRRRASTPSDYEPNDTAASLTMGVASLVVPLATGAIARRVAPQRSFAGKALVGVAALAGGVTVVADRLRGEREDGRAATVARITGPVAVASGAIAICTGWAMAATPKRMWAGRRLRDRGTGPLAVAAAIAGWDFVYYWNHRFMHEARYMWAIHVVHHSSERYNLSTALRQPIADALGTFAPYGLLCRLGIRPALVQSAHGINLLYQYWIHTDAIRSLGVAEEVLNTPSHHRVHHGSNARYIDRNHGSILICWDRLFGTFQRERGDDPVVYGLTKNIESFNPVRIATHEYVDIVRDVADSRNWHDRLSYVVRGPGWAYARHADRAAAGVS